MKERRDSSLLLCGFFIGVYPRPSRFIGTGLRFQPLLLAVVVEPEFALFSFAPFAVRFLPFCSWW
jgi:hypothetical protein